jgi:hypothetical protein
MKICMVGAGYVGLVSSACFAEFGWNVSCVDKDVERIAALKRGEIPIYDRVWMRLGGTIRGPDVFAFLHFSQMLCQKPTSCFSQLVRRCGVVMVTRILATFMKLSPNCASPRKRCHRSN